jgi:Flp pilus assembly protein TadD
VRLILLSVLVLGCASRNTRNDVDPTPSWATADGRTQAKIELAEALVVNGTPEAALKMISQMVEQGVRHPDILVLQGRALTDMGLVEEAEMALTRATRRAPGHSEAQNRLGILYMDQQRTDEALQRFRAAVRSAPKDADIHNNYGFALMAAGRHTDAVPVLRSALMLDGSQAKTRNNLGFALAVSGQDKAALRVLRAGSNDWSARYNLALAQELRGDTQEAIASYLQALEANPDLSEATDAIARLSKLPQPAVSSPAEDQ